MSTKSFTKEFQQGFSAYSEANRVMAKHNLWKFLFIPGLVTLGYAVLYFFFAIKISSGFSDQADHYPWWLSWMGGATIWVAKIIFWPIALLVFIFSYKVITQVVLSPVLSYLSEVVEHRELKGDAPKTGLAEILSDVWRGLIINVRNLFREVIFSILAGFIPLVGSIIGFGISSYYTGFNFMDYTMERHRMTVKESVRFVHQHRGMATGIGFMCLLGMMIPVIGWFIMPTYATVAATLQTYRLIKADPMAGRSSS